MKKNIKNIIIFVIILALAGVGYYIFTTQMPVSEKIGTTSGLQTSSGTAPTNSIINPDQVTLTQDDASKISQQFVSQLGSLKAIKLTDDIFSSLAFQSLEDFSIILVQPGNEGRPNPFAPFDTDGEDPNAPEGQEVGDGGIIITPINNLPGSTSGGNTGTTLPAPNNN